MPKKSNRVVDHWLFRKWTNMRAIVFNKASPDYKYGGAKNCEIYWDNFWDFAEWIETNLGKPPKDRKRLCRIDTDGDYAPGNLQWSNQFIHNNHNHSARLIKHNNQELSVKDWSRKTKISYWTLVQRLNKGWPPEKLFRKTRHDAA